MADLAALTQLAEQLQREAWERGYQRGLEIGMAQPPAPRAACTRCHGALRWLSLPESCGCRESICAHCCTIHVAECCGCAQSGGQP
jgi:hypothetical protein